MAPPRRQQRHGGDGGPAAGDADAIDEGDGDLAACDGGRAAAAAGDADAIDEGDGDLAAGDGGSDAADGGDGGPAAAGDADAIDEGDGDLAAGDGGSVTGAMEIPTMLPTEGTAVLPLEMPISPPVTGAMEIPMLPMEGTAVLPLEMPFLSTDEGDGDLAAGDGGHGDSDAIDESSDLDAILKSKDQTISLLDKKVRANETIFVSFKERVKEQLSVISALEKDIDTKNQLIGNLNSWACNNLNREKKSLERAVEKLQEKDNEIGVLKEVIESKNLTLQEKDNEIGVLKEVIESKNLTLQEKDNEIGVLKEVIESKNLTLQEKDNEIGVLKEVIESKNLTLGVFESKIQQLEREYTNSTDEIVRQFNDLVIIGEMRLKQKAEFDDIQQTVSSLKNVNFHLTCRLDTMSHKLRCLQIRGIALEEEQWRNVFELEVIITCYAGAYKELKAWFKKRCKEMEVFFKRQHDMIDS